MDRNAYKILEINKLLANAFNALANILFGVILTALIFTAGSVCFFCIIFTKLIHLFTINVFRFYTYILKNFYD